jgi:hypothetical protein
MEEEERLSERGSLMDGPLEEKLGTLTNIIPKTKAVREMVKNPNTFEEPFKSQKQTKNAKKPKPSVHTVGKAQLLPEGSNFH